MKGKSIMHASLLESEIPGLRERVKKGWTTTAQEADRFGVGVETIRRAVRGETFRNVREGLPETVEATAGTYGRRKDDLVTQDDAERSEAMLRELAAKGATDPSDPVADFIKARKEQTK